MKYISDDGKIFDTERECCNHENELMEERHRIENGKVRQVEIIKKYNIVGRMCKEPSTVIGTKKMLIKCLIKNKLRWVW